MDDEKRTPGDTPEEEASAMPADEAPAEGEEEPTQPSGHPGEAGAEDGGEEAAEEATVAEDQATEITAAAEESTGAEEAVGEESPGEDAELAESQPTETTAAAAGAGPGPQSSHPTTNAPPPQRSYAWVWALVVIVIVLLVAAAAWLYFARQGEETPVASPSPAPVVWAGAWARIDGVPGGLLVTDSAGAYEVTLYDSALRPGESVPATLSADGGELQFVLPSQFSFSGPSGPFEAALTISDDPDVATLRITGADQTSTLMPLRRAEALTPASPSGSPMAGESPSASPSAL